MDRGAGGAGRRPGRRRRRSAPHPGRAQVLTRRLIDSLGCTAAPIPSSSARPLSCSASRCSLPSRSTGGCSTRRGGFLGPSYIRLPLLLIGALLLDLLPLTLWRARGRPSRVVPIVKHRLRTHWSKERAILVGVGVIGFYLTYVSLPEPQVVPAVRPLRPERASGRGAGAVVRPGACTCSTRSSSSATTPATCCTASSARPSPPRLLSPIYLGFLPLVPLAVTAWLVWSRNMSFGYWFVTSQCLAWSLGTLSYYLLPTLGPGIAYTSEYYGVNGLAHTGTTDLMDAIVRARGNVLYGGATESVNSIAGFASLHCAITLLFALMVQYTLRSKILKIVFWVNFGLTVIATLYFGWHYVADDLAGIAIAIVSFYVGGVASGQKFDRRGHSHPTTTTSKVPVDVD
ncbi:inositol phosphorylceramide synthase [Nocardioides sp. W3-2-3]|uniref:phosphatase PAP2 family protein n=1 Tax=Nocardioides convexus TaxID=2712224 RepID=UPI00241895EA|nr:phosphatase PAP2 family protein [Nocardioides convexus]NHA00792.1 inositol phosphorylceramide synthase [Nocardioides convexus]